MKRVKCYNCKKEREVNNNVIFAICPCCQIQMEDIKKDETRNIK